MISQTFASLAGAQSLGASGYIKLGAEVIQWGTTPSLANNTPQAVTFPVAFPTACAQVVMTPATALGSNEYIGQSASSETTTGFTAAGYSSLATARAFQYIAIGY